MTSTIPTRLPERGEVADLLLDVVRRLVREQGFRFIPKGKSKHPKLYAPDGERWMPLPTTLFDGPVRHTYLANLRRIGADLTFPAETVTPAPDAAGMTSYEQIETPWTDAEWRELQRESEHWWRRQFAPEVEAEPEPAPELEPAPRPQMTAAGRALMERLGGPTVRADAQGNGDYTLAEARQLLRDGYSLPRVVERTGWGTMWLDDLARRLREEGEYSREQSA